MRINLQLHAFFYEYEHMIICKVNGQFVIRIIELYAGISLCNYLNLPCKENPGNIKNTLIINYNYLFANYTQFFKLQKDILVSL